MRAKSRRNATRFSRVESADERPGQMIAGDHRIGGGYDERAVQRRRRGGELPRQPPGADHGGIGGGA
jgi:hypothetical protein